MVSGSERDRRRPPIVDYSVELGLGHRRQEFSGPRCHGLVVVDQRLRALGPDGGDLRSAVAVASSSTSAET
ncbi:MAG: hypothetical protein M3431_00025, partial [Actinomycetota bacterium]|nr:hypothetical protein [Actinomycetota bacterium]